MGIADRDYNRRTGPAGSPLDGLNALSVTAWLIVLNVAVFVLDCLTTRYVHLPMGRARSEPLYFWGAFNTRTALRALQLWRFVTFQFLHANYVHLFVNMLMLFFFGPLIETYLGRARFLAFYILCGMAGPLSFMLFYGLNSNQSLIGASAGVFGVLVAGSQVAPDATVLIYGLIPARLRTVAWILLGVAAFTVLTNGHNAGGEAAHLGGAAVGFLLIKNERWLDSFTFGGKR